MFKRSATVLPAAIAVLMAGPGANPPRAAMPVPVEKEPLHRLVFSNSEVQVLDVLLPPQATTLFHTHMHDVAGLTISSAPSRTELLGEAPMDDPADPEGAVWFEPYPKPSTHRVTNLGSKPIHYLVFQLLGVPRPESLPWGAAEQGTVVLENSRVRVVRTDLRPGERASEHGHRTGYGIVAMTKGRLEDDDGPVEALSGAGFVRWRGRSEHHGLRNAGDNRVQILEFEIRG